jgi:hypothetical protein
VHTLILSYQNAASLQKRCTYYPTLVTATSRDWQCPAHEDAHQMQEAFSWRPQKATRRDSLQFPSAGLFMATKCRSYRLYSRTINPTISNLPKTVCQTSKLMKIMLRERYSVMKPWLQTDGIGKPSHHLKNGKRLCKGESGVFCHIAQILSAKKNTYVEVSVHSAVVSL